MSKTLLLATNGLDEIDAVVPPAIFGIGMASCSCPSGRRNSSTRKTHRERGVAGDGTGRASNYQNYHRVLNRAVWSSRKASFILLRHLIAVFVPVGPLVMGLDDPIERRWGEQIEARGIYRDPVRSSDSHFVKVIGLRGLSLMLLVPLPWAERTWTLPFLTALAPSERYHQAQGKRHKRLTDWARQMLHQVRRWLPNRAIVVADSSFAALELLWALVQMSTPVYVVTRLRLDAQLYEPTPPRQPRQMGRPRKVGQRLSALKTRVDNPDTAWQVVVVHDSARETTPSKSPQRRPSGTKLGCLRSPFDGY